MQISARNQLKGKVTKVVHGPVGAEVTIQVAPGIEIVSTITDNSARSLGLEQGKQVYAIIKASNVMVAVE